MTLRTSEQDWAEGHFGGAELGDVRRSARLVKMAAQVGSNPSGTVSGVFQNTREREGAYDLLENAAFGYAEVLAPHYRATADRLLATGCPYAFVVVDGSSLTFTDRHRAKDLGPIGTRSKGAQGLKTLSALAVESDGIVAGLLALTMWTRPCRRPKAVRKRKVAQKETQRWIDILHAAHGAFPDTLDPWFVIDREADSAALLLTLDDLGSAFTIRAHHDRVVRRADGSTGKLGDFLEALPPRHAYDVRVTGRPGRRARTAKMVVTAEEVTLVLRDPDTRVTRDVTVNAVRAREVGTTPEGETPLDWWLYTRAPIDSDLDLGMVLESYAFRWRIEEFHKTWKTGRCNVESSQLRSPGALTKWSALLAVTATEIERVKRLARQKPTRKALTEFAAYELEALVLVKLPARERPKNLSRFVRTLTIANVVTWIAELGGYTGKASGGPPGSITIARGLDYLKPLAAGYRLARLEMK